MPFSFHYLLYVAVPLAVLMGAVQLYLRATYGKFSKIGTRSGMTGADTARLVLKAKGLHNVRVERVAGFLSAHYDPRSKVLRLSPDNFDGQSIAALGVAAHEAGHAVQDAERYPMLVLRNLAVPAANIGSNLGWVAIMLGFVMKLPVLMYLGLLGIAAIAVFQLINLPVEFDASRRALELLPQSGALTEEENRGARSVLIAAALTYVAGTIAAIWTLLYYLIQLGILGGRDE